MSGNRNGQYNFQKYNPENSCFFGDILNSFNWVTQIGPKTTQKNFFENISKNMATRGGWNFGLIEGAAVLLLEESQNFWPQISTQKW